jgi:hypothetical protein
LETIMNNLSPIRPLTKEEEKRIEAAGGLIEWYKGTPKRLSEIPEKLAQIPQQIEAVYESGDIETQAQMTVELISLPFSVMKGKTNSLFPGVVQAGFKLPKLSLAYKDWFTKGPHAYAGKGEALFYLYDAGSISVKATGKNLSKKDSAEIIKIGEEALTHKSFRDAIVKKIDDSLLLKEAEIFKNGASKLKDFKEAIQKIK